MVLIKIVDIGGFAAILDKFDEGTAGSTARLSTSIINILKGEFPIEDIPLVILDQLAEGGRRLMSLDGLLTVFSAMLASGAVRVVASQENVSIPQLKIPFVPITLTL